MKLVQDHPLRSKTNDPDSAWMHYRCAGVDTAAAARAQGRHFRRIVDRVRDDDGDLEEVLEPRSYD